MKNYFILLSIFFLSFLPKQEAINWQNGSELNWKSFKAKAPRSSSYRALSAVGISAGMSLENNILELTVQSFFEPKESWTKEKESEYLLNHEQMHFNISEIHARRLRKEYLNADWTLKNFNSNFSKMLKKQLAEENKMQKAYDSETNHSIVKEEQTRWDRFIKKELKELNRYGSNRVVLKLK
mgnify:CR=1 FL=1